jgi:hypothetical protein
VLAVGHEEIEFTVLGVGDQRRRDLVEGVPEAELLFPIEEIAGNGLPPLQLGKDRLQGGAPTGIVVVKSHRIRELPRPVDGVFCGRIS